MVLREMEKTNMVDVSCFFLFEASGDSEGGLDPLLPEMGCSVSPDMDAESCCDDDETGDDGGVERGKFEERESEDEMISHCQRWCEEEEEEEEEEEDAEKNRLNRDEEFLNEMDKNRLFWEACLAS